MFLSYSKFEGRAALAAPGDNRASDRSCWLPFTSRGHQRNANLYPILMLRKPPRRVDHQGWSTSGATLFTRLVAITVVLVFCILMSKILDMKSDVYYYMFYKRYYL